MKALVLNRLNIGRNFEAMLPFSLTYTFEAGKIYHIKGKNGSGKTTLLRTFSGYIPFLSGEVFWHNKKVSSSFLSEISCYFGHDNGLKTGLTARKYLDYCYRLFKNIKDMHAVIEYFGFHNLLDVPIHFLSCGQKKRLSLIAVLCCDRDIYCLDEASSGLDIDYQMILYSYLRDVLLKRNKLILCTDHHIIPIDTIHSLSLHDCKTI